MVLHQNNSSFRRKGLNLLNFELVKTRNRKDRKEVGQEAAKKEMYK